MATICPDVASEAEAGPGGDDVDALSAVLASVSPPPPPSILLVDSSPAAAAALPLLRAASLAALDAEWKPIIGRRGGGAPKADLVQVGLRFESTACGSPRPDMTLLLDLVALPAPTSRDLLAALLASEACLVGYGLAGDLAAVAWVVGREAAAAARAGSGVELRRAHAALRGGGPPHRHHHRHHHAPSRRASRAAAADADARAGRGLAGLVTALTGATLEKGEASPQLSDWAARPLSPAQVSYAAADVGAVLSVFDALVAGGRAGGAPFSSLEDAARAAAGGLVATPPRPPPGASAAAAASWAGPLNESHHHHRHPPRPAALPPLPAPRPWPPGTPPAFACDEALGGLARQLRLAGVDAACLPPRKPPPGRARQTPAERADARAATARALVALAAAGGPARPRVLLTTDAALARAAEGTTGVAAFHVTTAGRHAQLEAVLAAFALGPLDRGALLSRCTACNGELDPEAFPARADLPPRCTQLPPAECGPFWACGEEGCGQVYWQGGQYRRALGQLTARLEAAGL